MLDARVIYSYIRESYIHGQGDVQHHQTEAKMLAANWDFLTDPTVADAVVRTKLLDFFALSNKLAPGRRGDTLYWALEIIYKLPVALNIYGPELASAARRSGNMLTPVGFANAVIQKLHEYQLSAPGRAAAAARPPLDSPSRPVIAATEPSLLSLTRDRAERESRPTCPDCKLRDCPRAKAATAPCDVHSTPDGGAPRTDRSVGQQDVP